VPLSEAQRKQLKRLGHNLKPVVIIGNAGLSEAVLAEIDIALSHHELIKVRVNAGDREARDAMVASMCERSTAELVQRIGHIALIFRRNPDRPRVELPR